MDKFNLHKKDIVYLARILPSTGIFEVCELSIRTVTDDYFVGTDKYTKHAYLLNYKSLNKTVFKKRNKALNLIKEAENSKQKIIADEIYYEEY